MTNGIPHYRRVLQEAYEQRLERNPRYSVRAFAASLKLDSSACSQLLSGKRVPSVALATRLVEKLNLDSRERLAFMKSLGEAKLASGLKRINPELRELAIRRGKVSVPTRRDLSVDAFQAISRWYYYAILELVKLPGFEDSPRWISRQLGIPEVEARIAYDRLFELEMLEREGGRVVKTRESFHSGDVHLTSAGHRRRQKEVLLKSIEALENRPVTERSHNAMTVAINPARIPAAKKKIAAFLQELSEFLEEGGPKEVYEIQLGLFSLQTPLEKERPSQ